MVEVLREAGGETPRPTHQFDYTGDNTGAQKITSMPGMELTGGQAPLLPPELIGPQY